MVKNLIVNEVQDSPKDELELATSWTRVFSQFYTKLRWLQGFNQINNIACLKLLKKASKLLKEFPGLTKEIENINIYLHSRSFVQDDEIEVLKLSLVTFFAHTFTKGKKGKAVKLLDKGSFQIRSKDICLISFFGGILIAGLLCFFMLVFTDGSQFLI